MTASRSTRRTRRGALVRKAIWISAAAMLATAALAPATASAANPTSMDVACNNIVHGGRSPEYVWLSVDAAGVTASWATDAAHFDAANYDTVTVRVCVADADGADHGAIDQNTENDGSQLFPWSVLGYAQNPCPDDSLTFGASVDSPAVETKKSDMVACPAGSDEETPPTDEGSQPADEGSQPADEGSQPADEGSQPADEGSQPADEGSQPVDDGSQPTGEIGDPTQGTNDPSDSPTGAVEGVTGHPGVTPPPTDTLAAATARTSGSDGWRMVLAIVSFALVGTLVFTAPKPARRKA
jgi:hypothetical protein